MFPFLFMRSASHSEFFTFFANGLTTYSMTTADTASITTTYWKTGIPIDALKGYVNSGSGDVEFFSASFSSTDNIPTSGTSFNSSSTGWIGAGTYTCSFKARTTATGLYDQTSVTATLTVT